MVLRFAAAGVTKRDQNQCLRQTTTISSMGMFLVSGSRNATNRVITVTQAAKKRKMPYCAQQPEQASEPNKEEPVQLMRGQGGLAKRGFFNPLASASYSTADLHSSTWTALQVQLVRATCPMQPNNMQGAFV